MAAPPNYHHQQPSSDSNSASSNACSSHHHEEGPALVRLMCSFGGRILPRPHDNQLRYAGGETRIVAVHRHVGFPALLAKLSKLAGLPPADVTVKYQLPHEDLDALISVANEEDVENMMEEYDRLVAGTSVGGQAAAAAVPRLRLFLFPFTRPAGFDSIEAKHEKWFVDALNSGLAARLDRGRSEVSSVVSEVPDYLFGLDSSNSYDHHGDPKPLKSAASLVSSEPDPPNPVKSPSVQSVQDHEPDMNQNKPIFNPVHGSIGLSTNLMWQQYSPQPAPVYYIPGPVPVQAPYPQTLPVVAGGTAPLAYQNPVPSGVQMYATGGFDYASPVVPVYTTSSMPIGSEMMMNLAAAKEVPR